MLLAVGCGQRDSGPPVTPVSAKEVTQAVRNSGAKVVLVNMWAVWCGPCREEFPDIVKLERDYRDRGLRVMFVSWDDNPRVARAFLTKQGVDYPSYIKADYENDMQFINGFEPRWTGAFPATFVYDGSGKLQDFWEGKAPYATFERAVLKVLNETKGEQS